MKHVAVNHPNPLSPDEWMCSTRKGSIVPVHKRPTMRVSLDKTTIKAGGNDAAVLTGAPKDVAFSVSVGDSLVWSGTLPDGELDVVAVLKPEDAPLVRQVRRKLTSTGNRHLLETAQYFTKILYTMVK